MRLSLALLGCAGWLVAFALLVSPSAAQTPLYSACVTVTPSSTIPATMTTVPIQQSPSPSPTLNGIFQTATVLATISPTPFTFPTPTIDTFTNTPIPMGARYRVDSTIGVNVRAGAGLSYTAFSSLPYGAVVVVSEMTPNYINGWSWGKVGNGWVAMRSSGGAINLVAVP